MHQILVMDPNGTTHPNASVWNNAEEPELGAAEAQPGKIASLMQSAVEEEKERLQEATDHRSQVLFTTECQLVRPMLLIPGKLELSTQSLSFTISEEFTRELAEQIERQDRYMASNKRLEGVNKYRMLKLPENSFWHLSEITHEEYRLHLFSDRAVELFFTDSTSAFFVFTSHAVRAAFHTQLRTLSPPNLTEFLGETPAERFAKDSSMQRWLNHEISNFEYLTRLNRLAGRTYNDLSQYPVFPWVLADYTSSTIDLRDPRVYRDFAFPMGAQLEARREMLKVGAARAAEA